MTDWASNVPDQVSEAADPKRTMVGMSNFVLNSSTLEAMIGVSLGVGAGVSEQRRDQERRALTGELLAAVRDCQKRYASKTELATEQDPNILALCDVWERSLSHGLRLSGSMLQNVVEMVGGGAVIGSSTVDGPCFWDFAYRHLTNHERERFGTLRHVRSRSGRGRALLRAVLNERALERYVLMWLGDEQLLAECYEPWAMIRDGEVQGVLPSAAAGLSTILFAMSIDAPELNVARRRAVEEKPEPIIATRRPVGPVRKINAVERKILEDVPQHPSGSVVVPPEATPMLLPNAPVRSNSIDIVQTAQPTPGDDTSYSVEEALGALHLSREGPPEPAEDSMLSGYGFNYSTATATSTSGASDSGDSERFRLLPQTSASADLAAMATELHTGDYVPPTGYDKLKRKYHELEERCHLLESRVAELSLENHRLRMLTRSNRLSVSFFSFSIPKAIQRTPSSGTSRRPYHVYEIRITPSGVSGSSSGNESWCVYRRYNEFYRLHRRLQKEYPTIKTLDFPPKKKIGNMNAIFVEQRRQRLQVYLNSLFVSALPEVLSCSTRALLEETFPFLSEPPSMST